MTTQEVKRKLTAILSADVKGYSRLMEGDEKGTVRTLNAYKELMAGLIQRHHGRVVDAPGDNLLAEFASVVDAVECAVEIQKELKTRNAELTENRRMEFRIGVNLGDVIEEEGRIYGDGVNIAARLEGLSEAGSICISGKAYDEVKNKLQLGYKYLGEQTVKNVAEPVRTYQILLAPEAVGKVIGEKKAKPTQGQRLAFVVVAILFVVAASVAIWKFYIRPATPPIEVASKNKMAYPLPDKPSIAVLPFTNMSDDPKQEYFCDGMTEEIITALSKSPELFVIARNSTFVYKGRPVRVKQVSEELGVRYVLEGSIRREANRVRITAQFIDALTGYHLWTERYDREMKEVLVLQDEIALKIMTALHVKLQRDDARVMARGVKNLEAYLKAMEGRERFSRGTKEGNALARKLAEEAVALDANYARGYGLLAATHRQDIFLGTTKSPKESLKRAIELIQKAIALDPSDGSSRSSLALLYAMSRQWDKGFPEVERALALEPNSPEVLFNSGNFLNLASKPEEAIPLLKESIRLNPFAPAAQFQVLSGAYCQTRKHEDAIEMAKLAVQRAPESHSSYVQLAAVLSAGGRDDEARAAAAQVLKINPTFSLEQFARALAFKNQEHLNYMIAALRKAGLPEKPSASIPPSGEGAPKEKIPAPKSEKASKPVTPEPPKEEIASREKMAFPLPDVPSIAVMPFVNMSEDPKQEFFSDGITENIITALSKVPRLFVISRQSTFFYKGKPVKVKQVSEDLGVQYVLEGSVQRSADRIRINAQLIDALTGHHIWAERYDRDLTDLFILQDEITMRILTAVRVKLTEGEVSSAYSKYFKGKQGFDCYLKLMEATKYIDRFTIEDINLARRLNEEAISLCPENPIGYALLSQVYMQDVILGSVKSPRETLGKGEELVKKALAMDDSLPIAHFLLTGFYLARRNYDDAISEGERAVALDPGGSSAYFQYGSALLFACRPEEAIPMFRKAIRLNPNAEAYNFGFFGTALRMAGRFEEAVFTFKKALQRSPHFIMAHLGLAATYSMMGREKEARGEAEEILRINPKFSLDYYSRTVLTYKDQSEIEKVVNALRKVGLK
jgi:adenylate cyclase